MTEPFTRDSDIEMEDGREARIVDLSPCIGLNGEDLVRVQFKGPAHKHELDDHDNKQSWWYSCVTGEFDGDQGGGSYFRIVHKKQPSNVPEEW